MKKTYLFAVVILLVSSALAATIYLYGYTDVEALSTEVQSISQLQKEATPELTLLKNIVQYVQRFLPTL